MENKTQEQLKQLRESKESCLQTLKAIENKISELEQPKENYEPALPELENPEFIHSPCCNALIFKKTGCCIKCGKNCKEQPTSTDES